MEQRVALCQLPACHSLIAIWMDQPLGALDLIAAIVKMTHAAFKHQVAMTVGITHHFR